MSHIAARTRSLALAPFISSFYYDESEVAAAAERILKQRGRFR